MFKFPKLPFSIRNRVPLVLAAVILTAVVRTTAPVVRSGVVAAAGRRRRVGRRGLSRPLLRMPQHRVPIKVLPTKVNVLGLRRSRRLVAGRRICRRCCGGRPRRRSCCHDRGFDRGGRGRPAAPGVDGRRLDHGAVDVAVGGSGVCSVCGPVDPLLLLLVVVMMRTFAPTLLLQVVMTFSAAAAGVSMLTELSLLPSVPTVLALLAERAAHSEDKFAADDQTEKCQILSLPSSAEFVIPLLAEIISPPSGGGGGGAMAVTPKPKWLSVAPAVVAPPLLL